MSYVLMAVGPPVCEKIYYGTKFMWMLFLINIYVDAIFIHKIISYKFYFNNIEKCVQKYVSSLRFGFSALTI